MMENVGEFETPQVYVHLIHGTWATGILPPIFNRFLPTPSTRAWFESGSDFHVFLVQKFQHFPVAIDCSFRWSGRNSFRARQQAADALRAKLSEVHAHYPQALQVLVAHSHGGTLAAQAIGQIGLHVSPSHSIHALVCLSTPFLYLRAQYGHQRIRWAAAWALVSSAIINSWLAQHSVLQDHNPWSLLALMLLVQLSASLLTALSTFSSTEGNRSWRMLPPHLRVSLLRTPRDEASLALGLARSFHWIGSLFYSPQRLVLCLIPMLAAPFAYLQLESSTRVANISGPALIYLSCLLCLSVLPFFYITVFLLFALATGMSDPREWGKQIIELESAPLDHPCEIRILREPEEDADRMRHTRVYNYFSIRNAVAEEISLALKRFAANHKGRYSPGGDAHK